MTIAQLTEVSLQFGAHTVLDTVSMTLTAGDRLALTGHNGSGKSCLMRIIAGELSPDSGTVVPTRGRRMGYLPQTAVAPPQLQLREAAEAAFSRAHRIQERRLELERRLAERGPEAEDTDTLLSEYQELGEELERSGYETREALIDRVLRGLGFTESDFARRCSEFSGGRQMRIALARILLEAPDLLLLDEPTNYLDLEARDWLLQFIRTYRGGVVIVSHDRYFLDSCINAVAELFRGRVRRYSGNYSSYRRQRSQELEAQREAYERQQQEIERLERFIARFRYNASKAQLVQSRIKQLEKIERIELPDSLKTVSIRFPAPERSSRIVLQSSELTKSYDGAPPVFADLSLTLERGEKLALIGPNGSGKSSLLRILAGRDTSFSGELSHGNGVTLGYFSQEEIEELNAPNTVLEELQAGAPPDLQGRLRDLLGAFLFSGDDIHKPLSVLSGGERTRVALLKLVLRRHNLLVLDEPTNHLDLHSQEILQSALRGFDGTVVFVSHDREFLADVATKILEFTPQAGERPSLHTLYSGDYEYYRWKTASQPEAAGTENGRAAGAQAAAAQAAAQAAGAQAPPGASEQERIERKAHKAELGRIEREEQGIVTRLEELEQRREELHRELSDPEIYADGERVKPLTLELSQNEDAHERLLTRWEELEQRKSTIVSEIA